MRRIRSSGVSLPQAWRIRTDKKQFRIAGSEFGPHVVEHVAMVCIHNSQFKIHHSAHGGLVLASGRGVVY